MSSGDPKTPPKIPGKPHSLADHMFGEAASHEHAPGEDHDHDHDNDGHEVLDPNSKALELVPLVSMGLDIGSSGTQIVFSRLTMRGPGEPMAMRRQTKSRETLYLSPVALTPFADAQTIDTQKLRAIVDRAYAAAGLTPDDIETGAVIMTGAAARRINAQAIAAMLSAEGGELVAAVAGDHMEAMLAAYGSGAVERSRRDGSRIVNVDVGGATTKFALIEDGRIRVTAAMHGGGRLMAIDRQDKITRLDPAGAAFAASAGIDWRVGASAQRDDMQRVADDMADAIASVLASPALPPATQSLFVTDPLPPLAALDGVLFSGGVAEYVYGRETRDFGDLGWRLGRALRARCDTGAIPWSLLPAGECIRATALGASEFSVQMSGSTCCITSHAALLPRRNLPVIQPPFDFSGALDAAALASAIRAHREAFGDDDPTREMAFAFRWRGEPSWERLRACGEGIAAGLADRIATGGPLFLMIEGDAALNLGAMLRQELHIENEILVIDGIVLRDFDYVDLGRIRLPSGMLPVTVKTLVFGAAP
jgi:ethanolamine utilization protein EutA